MNECEANKGWGKCGLIVYSNNASLTAAKNSREWNMTTLWRALVKHCIGWVSVAASSLEIDGNCKAERRLTADLDMIKGFV